MADQDTIRPVPYSRPVISGEIKFDENVDTHDWNTAPRDETLVESPVLRDWRLSEIRYKNGGYIGGLSNIQLVFANGFKTSMFGLPLPETTQSIKIDPASDIRYVSVMLEERYQNVSASLNDSV